METYMKKQYRQGDVLLVAVSATPKGAEVVNTKGDVILAHGEVTGHAHRIKEHRKAKLLDFKAERFLQLTETVALSHEEHSVILLDKGTYRQAFQVEEKRKEIQRVAD
jgi:hypothetical protein